VLGCLQDSYATTPLGLHLGRPWCWVANGPGFSGAACCSSRWGFQALARLAALALQEVYLQFGTFILSYQPLFYYDLTKVHTMEILGTAALGPLMHLLVQGVTKLPAPSGLAAQK